MSTLLDHFEELAVAHGGSLDAVGCLVLNIPGRGLEVRLLVILVLDGTVVGCAAGREHFFAAAAASDGENGGWGGEEGAVLFVWVERAEVVVCGSSIACLLWH